MDSINQNQPEQNRSDLSGQDAIEKTKAMVEKAGTCFFCTNASGPSAQGVRPMSIQKHDTDGNLWFLSAADSRKNSELEKDSSATLFFQVSKHSGFLKLSGRATVSRDRQKINELWEPILKTWFTGGKDDGRITVIQFVPLEGYYWDTKHGVAVAGIKMAVGAAVGVTLDDSIEGRLTF